MKKSLLLAASLTSSPCLLAQTNTLPTTGNMGIGTAIAAERMEVYDGNNNLSSTIQDGLVTSAYKWSNDGVYPLAICVNASQNEIYFDSFEDVGVSVSPFAHAGSKFINGSYTVNWTKPNSKLFKISYFYFSSGAWKYKEVDYVGNSMALSGGTAYDDVRIYPADSQITTYTYDPLVGITSMTDPKGMTTSYEYDEFQRLKVVKDFKGYIIKSYQYNYKQ